MTRNGDGAVCNVIHKWLYTAAAAVLAACLLCGCTGEKNPGEDVPATKTDDASDKNNTDVTQPSSSTDWEEPRNTCVHDFKQTSYVPVTCAADGYDINRCSHCGQISITVTPALGHHFEVETPRAQSGAEMGKTYRCIRAGCTATYTDTGSAVEKEMTYVLPADGSDAAYVAPNDLARVGSGSVILPRGNAVWGYQSLDTASRLLYVDAMRVLLTFAAQNGNPPVPGQDAVCLRMNYTAYGLDEMQVRTALTYLIDDSPMLFWLDDTIRFDNGTVMLFVQDDWRDPADRISTAVQLETVLQTICETGAVLVSRMEGATDFDRAIAVYRAVNGALTAAEPNVEQADTAAGILTGKCSPLGYARLYTVLLNRINIPCITVRGADDTDAWNMLQLGGEWYAADAAEDDAGDAGWMRAFGTVDSANGKTPSVSSYPLPVSATVAVGPVTLTKADGTVTRCISPSAAFAAMTDKTGTYVLTPDADLALADSANVNPFAWSYTFPAGNWPRVASLTIEGAVASNSIFGSVALPLQIPGNPIIYSPVAFRNAVPRSNGWMMLIGTEVTFSGENATFSMMIGGDETSRVIFTYSGRLTLPRRLQIGTVVFTGTSPVVEGIVKCRDLQLTKGTNLELCGSYTVTTQKLTVENNCVLIISDRISGQGVLNVGSVAALSPKLEMKVRILSANDYPQMTFEERVTVKTSVEIEDTAMLPSAVAPTAFNGILYTLSGGVPTDWTLKYDGADVTSKTERDEAGQYRFITD